MEFFIVCIISFGFLCGLVDINKSFKSTSRAAAIFNINPGCGCVFHVNIKLIVLSEAPNRQTNCRCQSESIKEGKPLPYTKKEYSENEGCTAEAKSLWNLVVSNANQYTKTEIKANSTGSQ